MPKRAKTLHWLSLPEAHDYLAATSYLTLLFDTRRVWSLVRELRRTPINQFKAKDIFRASGLSLLGATNRHVAKDLQLIAKGQAISPLLLVRAPGSGRVVIADGYHRLCAVYAFDEDALIPCKIV